MNPVAIFLLVTAAFAVIYVSFSIRIIRPYERGLVERLGKFHRVLDPGLNLILPVFDTMVKMDMREMVLDVPPQLVITMDNVGVEVDAVIYGQVTDPFRAYYEINNYFNAATKLAQTNLRNVIGELDLDACLSSRDQINSQLRDVLDEATDKWGVKINRVELQRIDPPASRQSEINRADGMRQAQILEAEGYAEAVRKKADAERYRQIAVAEGESEAIAKVFRAIHDGNPDDKLITLKYLEMLPRLAEGQANKIFLPYEATGIISALAAMVEGLKTDKGNGVKHTSRPVSTAEHTPGAV